MMQPGMMGGGQITVNVQQPAAQVVQIATPVAVVVEVKKPEFVSEKEKERKRKPFFFFCRKVSRKQLEFMKKGYCAAAMIAVRYGFFFPSIFPHLVYIPIFSCNFCSASLGASAPAFRTPLLLLLLSSLLLLFEFFLSFFF